MKAKILLVVIICFGVISGCQKSGSNCNNDNNEPVILPRCIAAKIDEIKNEPKHNPPSEVHQFHYNGSVVYFFTSYCCDIPSVLYDENCNIICNPDGGLIGNGDGQCTDFFNVAKCDVLVWKDNR